jgi:putative hemolysin
VLGVVALTLILLFFALPFLNKYYSIFIAALGTIAIFLLVSTPRRLRFEENGEEAHIPTIALGFVPLHALLLPLTNLLERLSSGNYTEEDFRAEKEEELRSFVESESETGILEEGEKEMIQGVFGFHDSIVREVMIPRVDIVAVELSATLEELLQAIKESGHSRVPLYEETLDRIRGIIYTKDLLQILVGQEDLSKPLSAFVGQQDAGETMPPFVHEPYYVPQTKKIDELLHDLRAARTRLAIVIDEYSGTAGLVTTEDLVEEIVGEIQDEYDEEEELFYWKEAEDTLIANARLNIDDLNEMLETDLPSEGFETLGGFIYDHLGHIPSERQTFVTNNLEIDILKVDGQRIAQVQIKRLRAADKEKG